MTTARRTAIHHSSAAWTPASLSGLLAWYDADNAGSITSASNLVSQWNDLSGNGNHLVQATGGNKPSTGTATINSKNALVFASNKWLNNLALSSAGSQPFTLYMVVYITTFASFGMIFGNNSQTTTVVCGIGTRNTPSFMVRNTVNTTVNSTTTVTTNTAYAVVAVFNGASSTFTVAGTTENMAGNGSLGLGSALWVGSQNGGLNDSFYGRGGEFILQSGAGSAGDRTSFQSYASTKWGAT